MTHGEGKGSIKKGDFERIVLPYLEYLYRVAFHLVRKKKEDAEDLVQETFIKAYKSFHQLKDREKSRAWLTSILYNTFINKYRKEERVSIISQPIEGSIIYQENPETEILRGVMDQEVLEALFELPEEYSTVIVLSDIEGLSYKEISEGLGIPIGTARSRLSRGRTLLRGRLYQYARGRGYVK
jgi:RNA polymerase sigma-70 factor (ECF subfamily)